jgi:hypothetical protein
MPPVDYSQFNFIILILGVLIFNSIISTTATLPHSSYMASLIPGGTTEKEMHNTFGLEITLTEFTPASAELMQIASILWRNAIAILLHHFN